MPRGIAIPRTTRRVFGTLRLRHRCVGAALARPVYAYRDAVKNTGADQRRPYGALRFPGPRGAPRHCDSPDYAAPRGIAIPRTTRRVFGALRLRHRCVGAALAAARVCLPGRREEHGRRPAAPLRDIAIPRTTRCPEALRFPGLRGTPTGHCDSPDHAVPRGIAIPRTTRRVFGALRLRHRCVGAALIIDYPRARDVEIIQRLYLDGNVFEGGIDGLFSYAVLHFIAIARVEAYV